MKPNKFLDTLKAKYNVERIPDGTYVVSNGDRRVKIHESELCDQLCINRIFDLLGSPLAGFRNVGRDDLFPDTEEISVLRTVRKHPRGSLADPSIFRLPSGRPSEDEDTDPLINIDPITPSRNRKDSFEPDPDHYKPDKNSRFPPY
ncbi:uncharacterized protein Eint_080870 [Encephalitozoon intestinalis ATCC 50506]|uniref:Uncharacterized protein n=1 Tax=Encephalitozoon intestinalis (strain ATCC 50506) TaxID=876142 RepID=E0S8N8_ENCIT|nr:uncharacterized protein Eint_080870 [Encephalitozoon intestinalis ATCC 50506]ADM12021.1 hypothetical protein Eint_080870 [Encephalitozoon intestinalis ATCC 50506]UTX45809.1 hypothetical protein GPK93_08g13860 [Encephalitozoon intestinalis]